MINSLIEYATSLNNGTESLLTLLFSVSSLMDVYKLVGSLLHEITVKFCIIKVTIYSYSVSFLTYVAGSGISLHNVQSDPPLTSVGVGGFGWGRRGYAYDGRRGMFCLASPPPPTLNTHNVIYLYVYSRSR